jgi:putative redox protein
MPRITAELTHGTQVTISDGTHEWRADEPARLGGTDTGPTPYEQLLGALAACTCMTLAMYCRFREIPLTAVRASYDHDRVHSDDCEECENPDGGFIERVTSHVQIEGTMTDAQRDRLTAVAARCPVHKTLERGLVLVDHVEFV